MRNVYWVLAGILVSLLTNAFVLETTIFKQNNEISHELIFMCIGLYLLYFHFTERLKGFILFTFPIILFCLTPTISAMLGNFFKENSILFSIFSISLACILWSFILLKLTGKVTFNQKASNKSVIVSLSSIVLLFIFLILLLNTYKLPIINAAQILQEYSHGFLTFNLVMNVSLFLIVSFLLFLITPSRLFKRVIYEVVDLDKIKVGFVYLLIIYLFSNGFVFGLELLSNQSFSILTEEKGVLNLVGSFVGLFFGVALFEEAMFRLILPVLLVILLRNYFKKKHSIFIAILISSILFAFVHAITGFGSFDQLDYAQAISRLIGLFLSGQIFIYLYIVTKNLWIPIIVHALHDYGLLLFNFSNYSFVNVVWVMVFTSIILIQHGSENAINKEHTGQESIIRL
ncbi:CPBP family intramembrane glutamic endopeptidase [Bacillus sp. FJAT-27445]|uniref:CPBP family intramembrane glutamic endopeptidase n=1 Tax=Bacillus sp. FJAT-27445 TaxID=1679166 RepID=UPI00074391F2|nr:CPBP family intramembrane glutamic endopeptidase [Bacillus sp. FJAT-27445]